MKLQKLTALGLIALLVALAYGNSLQNRFANDDYFIIVKNQRITSLRYLPSLFTVDYWSNSIDPGETVQYYGALYRPLVLVTYSLNYALSGLNPLDYHVVNLLLHALVTWLLFLIAIQLGFSSEAAIIAAVLFAVHPIHTEAVTGIVGRAELLMAFGVLGGLWFAIEGKTVLSILAFAIGIFSKEQAALLPVLVFTDDVCLGNHFTRGNGGKTRSLLSRAAVIRYGGYLLVTAVYLWLRLLALRDHPLPPVNFLQNPMAFLHGSSRILTVLKVAGKYLWLCLWPASLSVDYSYNSVPIAASFLEPGVFLAVIAWGSLLVIAAWSIRYDKLAFFCIGLTVLAFLPVSNLLVPIGTVIGERLFYLPSAGLCLLVGLGWQQVSQWVDGRPRKSNTEARPRGMFGAEVSLRTFRFAGMALFTLLFTALTVRTFLRNRDWVNEETLIRKDFQVAPESGWLNTAMGNIAAGRQQWEQALEYYQSAIRIYPGYPREDWLFNNRYGKVLLELGKTDEAIEAFQRAITLNRAWSVPRYNLGLAFAKERRYKESEEAFRWAIFLNPEAADGYNSLSRLLIETGRFEEAVAAADESIRRAPNFLWAHFNRALALEKLGRPKEAAAGYEKVLSLDPSLDDVRQMLLKVQARLERH